ncbi:MAG: riboflavin biosynthesis protein RibF, partial [candidate division WOR-3 bacterium]
DGVHLGHRRIIAELKQAAQEFDIECGVVTFDPSPQLVLHKDFPFILTPRSEKQARLAQLGLDFLEFVQFDAQLSQTSAEDFVIQVILRPLRPRVIVIGYDHRFGREAKGNTDLLHSLGWKLGFEVRVVPEFRHQGEVVKSTVIRERLILGAVRQAAELLGYRYQVSGRIVSGQGLGRNLGFPTANIEVAPPEKLIPAAGVYAAYARIRPSSGDGQGTNDQPIPCAVNIGLRPTFAGESQTVEAHLLDFPDKTLLGQQLVLEFAERLRPEVKFKTPAELKEQITRDIALARQFL